MGIQVKKSIVSAICLVLLSESGLAGGFAIREQSAEGLGSAFAGIAAGTDGLSAMFWNPATISQHNDQGYVSESNASLILPYSRAKDGVGVGGSPDSGNIGVTALVPASYSVYGLTDEITLGMAISAPFGLSTDSDIWAGSPHGNVSDVFTLNVNPNVAYKPVDWITIAAGVQGEYLGVKLTSSAPAGAPLFYGKVNDIAFGFTAGILLEPNDALDIGIGFRSSMSHKADGDGTIGGFSGNISADLKTPEMITLGMKYDVNEQWKLMGGVEWANWSRFKELTIDFDAPGPTLTTVENWKDSWYFSAGAEYAMSDALTLRSGLAYEISPVTDADRTPRLPDNDRVWVSVGAGYKINNWLTANLAYSHVFMKDGGVNLAGGGGLPPLDANFKQHLDIVSASAVIDW